MSNSIKAPSRTRRCYRGLIPTASLTFLILTAAGCSNSLDAINTEPPGTTAPLATSTSYVTPTVAPSEPPLTTSIIDTPPPTTTSCIDENQPVDLFLLSSGTPGMITLDLIIQPLNGEGNSIVVEGRVEVRLWEIADPFTGQKGALIQEWAGIEVAAGDYDTLYNEVWLQLPYSGFEPEWGQNGIVEVELVCEESRITTQKEIKLRKSPDC
ncbi:MAG: hypothetical protein JW954_06900 [Dehalococcoidaceae bacterium]|nr:hypothetical protein [Dehalococcoidaceae bacterium]